MFRSMALFTAETAVLAGKRSGERRRELSAAKKLQPEPAPAVIPANVLPPVQNDDPFVEELTRAIEETLQELREAEVAKDRAALARALRDLRETYHLVTGEARPGIKRPGSDRRQRSSPIADPQPTPQEQPPASGQNG